MQVIKADSHTHGASEHIDRRRALQGLASWTSLLGAPIAWALEQQTSYTLVPFACATGRVWLLHAASVLFIILALGAGLIAWRSWHNPGHVENQDALRRTRFMAIVGMADSAFFTLLILVQAVPSFIFGPCQT